jgi:integrase
MGAIPFAAFTEEVRARYGTRAPATAAKIRQVLREFSELPCVRTTEDLTPKAIDCWLLAHPDRSRPTARSLLRAFRAVARYAVAMGYIHTSPFTHYSVAHYTRPLPRAKPKGPKWHPLDHLAGVLAGLEADARSPSATWKDRRLYALYATQLHLGLRSQTELMRLAIADVDLPGRTVRIVPRTARGQLKTDASEALLPLSEELAGVLAQWVESLRNEPGPLGATVWLWPTRNGLRPWTSGYPGTKPLDVLKAAGRRYGVEGLTFQSLRHSLATHGARLGLGPWEIKHLLRHSSERTQEHYVHECPEDLRAAVRAIRFRPDGPGRAA